LDATFEEVAATGQVAELLAIEDGVLVLARHFVFYADGQPRQASVSYLLADMVRDTPVADSANEPWPGGTIAQLATLGIEVTAVNETVSARMPAPAERQRLQIAEGIPVLCVTRTMLAGDRPVEAAVDVVMPADRFRLDYTISLTDP
jgi:GntR family transcriptional regulator